MMKTTIAVAVACLLAIGSGVAFPQADDSSRPMYVHINLGYQIPSLGDVNDYLKSNEQIFEDCLGHGVNWDELGGTLTLGGEIGKKISSSAFLGVRATYQSSKIDNSCSNAIGSMSYEPEYKLFEVALRAKFHIKSNTNLYFGLSGGFASGEFTEYLAGRFPSDPGMNVTYESEFTGSGLVLGGFGGYQVDLSPRTILTAEVGYKYRNLGTFDGYAESDQAGRYEGNATDNSGNEMDFDFSGVGIEAGVLFLFGG